MDFFIGDNTNVCLYRFICCGKFLALMLNDFSEKITIDSDYIEGNGEGNFATAYSYDSANFLKNAKVINNNSNSSAKAMILFPVSSADRNEPTLNNVKLISNGEIISYSSSINVKNYGLTGNKTLFPI